MKSLKSFQSIAVQYLCSASSKHCACWLFWLTMTVSASVASGQLPGELEHAWEYDPPLAVEWTPVEYRRPIEVDPELLKSADPTARKKALSAMIKAFDEKNHKQSESIRTALLAALSVPESNLTLRRLLVSAACLWLNKPDIDRLWDYAKDDTESRRTAERAFIREESLACMATWRARLKDSASHWIDLELAIDGLGAIKNVGDLVLIQGFLNRTDIPEGLQLQAARAIGNIAVAGKLDFVTSLIGKSKRIGHLMAVSAIEHEEAPEFVPLLKQIVSDGAGPARRIAFERLSIISPQDARKAADALIADSDSGVREAVVDFLFNTDETTAYLLAAKKLADPVESLRQKVRRRLLDKADVPEFRKLLDTIITQSLKAKPFEANEQGIVLSVELFDSSRCDAILKLLDHPNPSVAIRAGWALSRLAKDPAVLGAMLQHAQTWTDKLVPQSRPRVPDYIEHQLSFLIEGFGIHRYEPAIPLMERLIPKTDPPRLPTKMRCVAIWSLGKIFTGKMNPKLREQFEARVNDLVPNDSEVDEVRYCAIVALTMMGDQEALSTLSAHTGKTADPIETVARWAIKQFPENPISP